MKKIVLLTALFSMLYASSAFALITMSRHNLSASHVEVTETTPYADVYTTATTEVCVFCHTPHGGTTDGPLWNRGLASPSGYTMYSSTTMDATQPSGPGGISLACLSCHDGTIALDALRNAPGSGGFNATPTTQGWTFNGLGTSTNNSLPEDGRITNLTQNLADDHPISIRYANYGGTTLDPKFNTPTGSSTTAQWFEETANTRADDNEVKLYPTGGVFMVECASCHNPHGTTAATGTPAANLAPNGVDYATFLRKSNNASALCTTCHIK